MRREFLKDKKKTEKRVNFKVKNLKKFYIQFLLNGTGYTFCHSLLFVFIIVLIYFFGGGYFSFFLLILCRIIPNILLGVLICYNLE